jgi:hypothetical protein
MMGSASPVGAYTVLIAVTNSWVIRNFLHSGVLENIGLKDRAVFLIFDRAVASTLRNCGVPENRVIYSPFNCPRSVEILRSIVLYVHVFRHAPEFAKSKFNGGIRGFAYAALRFVDKRAFLDKLYLLLQCVLRHSLRRQVSKIITPKFDLFISAVPHSLEDNILATKAATLGVPVVNWILSWDNIFSKGLMMDADLYFVWGSVMKRQLTNIYGNQIQNKVIVFGAPHIGGRYRPKKIMSVELKRSALLYSTASGKHFPNEINLVRRIVQAFKLGHFPSFSTLIIRTHPAGPHVCFDQFVDSNAGVTVVHPTGASDTGLKSWRPETEELFELCNLLSTVSVSINVASTMSLDCLRHGIKVINLCGIFEESDLSVFYNFEHYSELVKMNLVTIVESYEALYSALRDPIQSAAPSDYQLFRTFVADTDSRVLSTARERLDTLLRA